MKLVRAALRRHVDDAAERETIFRGHGPGLYFELLHCIYSKIGVEVGVVAILRRHAIHHQIVGRVRSPVDAQIAKTRPAVAEAALHRPGIRVNIVRKEYQSERIAPIQREIRHEVIPDHLAQGGVVRIYQLAAPSCNCKLISADWSTWRLIPRRISFLNPADSAETS